LRAPGQLRTALLGVRLFVSSCRLGRKQLASRDPTQQAASGGPTSPTIPAFLWAMLPGSNQALSCHLRASLERGLPLDAHLLREAMITAFEASDQDGAWVWKEAYEASEAAAVLFLRKYGPGILTKAGGPARTLSMIERLSALLPSHTRRSEESDQFQQFSTILRKTGLPSAGSVIVAKDIETAKAGRKLDGGEMRGGQACRPAP
jgi:hypothetical protein